MKKTEYEKIRQLWELGSRLMGELAFEDNERMLDLAELDNLYPISERLKVCAGASDTEEGPPR